MYLFHKIYANEIKILAYFLFLLKKSYKNKDSLV